MNFPVDILTTADSESLEQSARDYMSELLSRNPEKHEFLNLPESKTINFGICNVGFVPLYGVNIKQKVLAVFSPEDTYKAIGLYLNGQWWSAEDILRTEDISRTGLVEVRTLGERIVLYVLNRIIYRTKEMAKDDVSFLCHGEDEIAKILWKDGEAIGFYSVKSEGSLCSNLLNHCYHLPVMETIFVRKSHRGKGHGLQMLEDFIDSFRKNYMGLKHPLSTSMYNVCKNYFSTYPANKDLLWEVEGAGGPFQRTQIAKKLQTMELTVNHNEQIMCKLTFDTEDTNAPVEEEIAKVKDTIEYTETVEEVVQSKITKEKNETLGTLCAKCSNLKHKKMKDTIEEATEKIIREDREPGIQSFEDEPMQVLDEYSHKIILPVQEDTDVTLEDISEITQFDFKEQKELTFEHEVLEVSLPTTRSATALEKEKNVQITSVMEIQSLGGNKGTEIVKSLDTTIGQENLQPFEIHQVVEMEIVKMTSQTEGAKLTEKGDIEVDPKTTGVIIQSQNDEDETDMIGTTSTDQDVEPDKKVHDEADDKSNAMSDLVENEDLDTAQILHSTRRRNRRKSNYLTPVRHSIRLQDQSPDGEPTQIVLRSITKHVGTASSKLHLRKNNGVKQQLMPPRQTKVVKLQKKAKQTTVETEGEQKNEAVKDCLQEENIGDANFQDAKQVKKTSEKVDKATNDSDKTIFVNVLEGTNVRSAKKKVKRKVAQHSAEATEIVSAEIGVAVAEEIESESVNVRAKEDLEIHTGTHAGKSTTNGEKTSAVEINLTKDVKNTEGETEETIAKHSAAQHVKEPENEPVEEMVSADDAVAKEMESESMIVTSEENRAAEQPAAEPGKRYKEDQATKMVQVEDGDRDLESTLTKKEKTEVVQEKERVKESTRKSSGRQRSTHQTPARRLKRVHDQLPEGKLAKRVLTSSTKASETTFKQMSSTKKQQNIYHINTRDTSRQKETQQSVQKSQFENIKSSSITTAKQNKTVEMTEAMDTTDISGNKETTQLKEDFVTFESASGNSTVQETLKKTIRSSKVAHYHNKVVQAEMHDDKQREEAVNETALDDNRENKSTSIVKLPKASVVLVDCSKVPSKQKDTNETSKITQSLELLTRSETATEEVAFSELKEQEPITETTQETVELGENNTEMDTEPKEDFVAMTVTNKSDLYKKQKKDRKHSTFSQRSTVHKSTTEEDTPDVMKRILSQRTPKKSTCVQKTYSPKHTKNSDAHSESNVDENKTGIEIPLASKNISVQEEEERISTYIAEHSVEEDDRQPRGEVAAMKNTVDESTLDANMTSSGLERTEEEIPAETEVTVITKHLRTRTVTATSPSPKKSQQLSTQVLEPHVMKIQAQISEASCKKDAGRETEKIRTPVKQKSKIKGNETSSKDDENEQEVEREQSVTSEKQQRTNICKDKAKKMEEIVKGKRMLLEGADSTGTKTAKENSDKENLIDQSEKTLQEKEPDSFDKEEARSENLDHEICEQYSALKKRLSEKTHVRESINIQEKQPEDNEGPTTDEILEQVDDAKAGKKKGISKKKKNAGKSTTNVEKTSVVEMSLNKDVKNAKGETEETIAKHSAVKHVKERENEPVEEMISADVAVAEEVESESVIVTSEENRVAEQPAVQMVQVEDGRKPITKGPKEITAKKIEIEKSVLLKDRDRNLESTLTKKEKTEGVQEKELVKESTGKSSGRQKSTYLTSARRSKRLHDQPLEGELAKDTNETSKITQSLELLTRSETATKEIAFSELKEQEPITETTQETVELGENNTEMDTEPKEDFVAMTVTNKSDLYKKQKKDRKHSTFSQRSTVHKSTTEEDTPDVMNRSLRQRTPKKSTGVQKTHPPKHTKNPDAHSEANVDENKTVLTHSNFAKGDMPTKNVEATNEGTFSMVIQQDKVINQGLTQTQDNKQVKEVENRENNQTTDNEITLASKNISVQEEEERISACIAEHSVEEDNRQPRGEVAAMENTVNESTLDTYMTSSGLKRTEEEIPAETEVTVITKHLRTRTVTATSPSPKKSQRLHTQVTKIQAQISESSCEKNAGRETQKTRTPVKQKSKIKGNETSSKDDENEQEVEREQSVTSGKQQRTNISKDKAKKVEQKMGEQYSALKKRLSEKTHVRESINIQEKQPEEKDDEGPTTSKILDQVEDAKADKKMAFSKRKRTILIQVTSEKKSKRYCIEHQGETSRQVVVESTGEDVSGQAKRNECTHTKMAPREEENEMTTDKKTESSDLVHDDFF